MLYKAGQSWESAPGPGPVKTPQVSIIGRCRAHFYAGSRQGSSNVQPHRTLTFCETDTGQRWGRGPTLTPHPRPPHPPKGEGQEQGVTAAAIARSEVTCTNRYTRRQHSAWKGLSTACSSSREDERSKQARSVSKRWAWIPGSWLSHSCLKLGVPPSLKKKVHLPLFFVLTSYNTLLRNKVKK